MTDVPDEALPSRVVLDGAEVELEMAWGSLGVRLRALIVERVPDGVLDEALEAASLAASGDTLFAGRDGSLVGTRFLAEPTDGQLRDAAWQLAKQLAGLHGFGRLIAEDKEVLDRIRNAPAGLPLPSAIEDLLGRQRTVTTAQAVWSEPDASHEPVGALQPGQFYEVVENSGEWTSVVDEAGRLVWVETRTLVNEEID